MLIAAKKNGQREIMKTAIYLYYSHL